MNKKACKNARKQSSAFPTFFICMFVVHKQIIRNLMKLRYKELVFSLSALLAIGCAKQSAPTGGPKDVDPPVALRSNPVNYSTNFKGKKFVVEFDEFIDLKNVNQELLVSPLVQKKPKVVMRGKKMVVRINNELQDSTTYNFNFFNSVTDLNEGNVLENFQFEFSTGDTFDSTYVGGQIVDAFSGKPMKGVYIMLYRNLEDSTPLTQKPECVGRTNNDGYFIVPNMKADVPYHMFALKDMNNNKKFDNNEEIAYLDSTVQPSFKPMAVSDTLHLIKSISRDRKDTVFYDSIHTYTIMVTTIDDISLNLFKEESHIQYLHDVYRHGKRQLAVAFNDLIDSAFSLTPIIDTVYSENWCLFEGEQPTDSVVFWITDSTLYKHDTLKMQVCYTMKDSNNADYLQCDTLEFIAKPDAKKTAKQEKKKGGLKSLLSKDEDKNEKIEKKKISELTVKHNIEKVLDLETPIILKMNYPIAEYNCDSIVLTKKEDEKESNVKFSITKKENTSRIYNIEFASEENSQYRIIIPSGSFTDIYGNTNDTIIQEFKTQLIDYYSNLIMNIAGLKCNHSIIQLLDAKEVVLREYTLSGDTTLTMEYLSPAKYKLKLYYDENANGKWDTGKFSERRQPERVFYFGEIIETKSGWDMEYTWNVE